MPIFAAMLFRHLHCLLVFLLLVAAPAGARRPPLGKLSPLLRQLVRQEPAASRRPTSDIALPSSAARCPAPDICALALVSSGDPAAVLREHGCRELDRVGRISIAAIPVDRLAELTCDERVSRVEAHPRCSAQTDVTAGKVGVGTVHAGTALPQAFTGRGVVVGVMDIGFDLTHPNFYDATATDYRISRLWDMLSTDTVGSTFYVGRDYRGRDELLTLAHSRDGLDQTHGTHTLGIAAGSGYTSPYRGMAPESDICLVANATSENAKLIDPLLLNRYTFETDVLGFKYLFDYAASVGKPCVVNFSEGSGEDFHGYDVLYYELLDQLLGPGRILVSAAGNNGRVKSWFRKPADVSAEGTFLTASGSRAVLTLTSADAFDMRTVAYMEQNDTLLVSTADVLAAEDSLLTVVGDTCTVEVQAYRSCYDPQVLCYDVTVRTPDGAPVGSKVPLSFEVTGSGADVSCWRVSGYFTEDSRNPLLAAGECHHNVLSPSTSPSVICVGATNYREGVTNYLGQWKQSEQGFGGQRAGYSSVGPTMDGRTKPDVMAPGTNIISSYSSYYLENHPTRGDITWDVEHFEFGGRTYPWNSNSGTSMASPVVAGVIALWLQAKPDLTPQEAMEVIRQTSRPYDTSLPCPNNYEGYGEIDAYRGLLYLLGLDGIRDISSRHTPLEVRCAGRRLTLTAPAPLGQPLRVRLFSLSGRQVLDRSLPSPDVRCPSSDAQRPSSAVYTIELPSLPAGIYAVQIDGSVPSGSTLIRL